MHTIESELQNAIPTIPRLIPYIQLHEFEALVFCGLKHLATLHSKSKQQIEALAQDLAQVGGNPELINHGTATAPSKRIIAAVEASGKERYYKVKDGKEITKAVGVEVLMASCPHFRQWVETILAATSTTSQP